MSDNLVEFLNNKKEKLDTKAEPGQIFNSYSLIDKRSHQEFSATKLHMCDRTLMW
jgi:hypothetical protein